jgi:hypothetical protein
MLLMKKITTLFNVLVFNSFAIIAVLISFQVHAQVVSTFVGAGSSGNSNGTGTSASFNGTVGLSVDASGNIYVADRENHLIRKITPAGVVSTFAGSGSAGSVNGTGTSASFRKPHDIAIDQSGNVYVADHDNHLIRKITSAGVVSTFAGSGSAGSANGTGTSASFNSPSGIAIGPNGNIYVTDKGNNLIRKITSAGVVSTFAGSGSAGSANGTGTSASFRNPYNLNCDLSGNVYVADHDNHLIRKITSAGVVSTFAGSGSAGSANGTGTSASFNNPRDIDFDASGNIYVCDKTNHLIRKITSAGVVSTYAGSGSTGSTNGTGTSASFNTPAGLVFDADDNLYISDYHNFLIRKILPQTQLGNDIDGETAGDEFGGSVSVSKNGKYMVVGAMYNDGNGSNSGHVRVYEYSSGSWSQLGSDIDGETAGDRSGSSTAISDNGTIVAIGAKLNDGGGSNFGHVRVYEYSSGSWSQLGSDIDGEAINDYSGESVSLSGDGSVIAISALSNDGNGTDAGHVRVYEYSSGSWSQLGSDIDGEAAYDKFGTAVSLSNNGTAVAIGAYYNDGNGSNSGHVRVYEYSSGSWSQLGSDIDGEAANDQSGKSVSLSSDGTKVAIGANRNDGNGTDAGHVRVYEYSSGSWSQLGSDIDGEAAGDYFGSAVSLSDDGTILAVGAIFNDGTGTNAGQARIYRYSGSSWSQLGSDIDGEAAGDLFGKAVSLSGDGTKLAIGANKNSGNGTYAGSVRTYNISASLPVDLIHFDVQTSNNLSSILHWATASEINNSHFEIERSYDAITFESVGEVAGNGNSQHLIEYTFVDESISLIQNTVFYRLKQVDFDGAFEYSDIRVVRFDRRADRPETAAYPNPFNQEVTIRVNANEPYTIQVTDINGLVVLSVDHTENRNHRLDVSEYTAGVYIIKVTSAQGTKHLKIIKQ